MFNAYNICINLKNALNTLFRSTSSKIVLNLYPPRICLSGIKLIFLIPFIVFRTISLVTLVLPAYPKPNGTGSVLAHCVVSLFLLNNYKILF